QALTGVVVDARTAVVGERQQDRRASTLAVRPTGRRSTADRRRDRRAVVDDLEVLRPWHRLLWDRRTAHQGVAPRAPVPVPVLLPRVRHRVPRGLAVVGEGVGGPRRGAAR